MKRYLAKSCVALAAALAIGAPAGAAVIDFTGGTVVRHSGPNQTTNNSVTWSDVDYYLEDGFRLDFLPTPVSGGSSYVGNYYGVGNDVIHAHWDAGDFGQVTMVKVTKIDGSAFDLNYFVLASNTHTGGGPASGTEQAFIHASVDGVTSSHSQLLPPENWGFPAQQIFLGSEFDNVKAFWFTVQSPVDCFGMDEFFIDQEPPSAVPVPASAILMVMGGVSALGYSGFRRRKQPVTA
jgi:hypothetical protein